MFSVANRLFQPLLVMLLAIGFLTASITTNFAEAGNKGYSSGKKMKINHSSSKRMTSGVRKTRMSNSNGMKHNGLKRSSGKSRTYVKRRSILDGGYGNELDRVSSNSKIHSRSLKSKSVQVKNRIHKNHSVRGSRDNIRLVKHRNKTGERRSGVKSEVTYLSGHSTNVRIKKNNRKNHGMRELAGGGIKIKKYRMGDNQADSTQQYTSAEVVVISGAVSGLQEIAGSGQYSSNDDCAYGTYCTIDLGGPKIITFNDSADIEDGAYVDEEFAEDMSEEEYLKKYGSK